MKSEPSGKDRPCCECSRGEVPYRDIKKILQWQMNVKEKCGKIRAELPQLRNPVPSSAATYVERKLAVGHFAKVISSEARVAERGLTPDGRCRKALSAYGPRSGSDPRGNGTNPNLAMSRSPKFPPTCIGWREPYHLSLNSSISWFR